MSAKKKPQFVPEVPHEKVYTNWLENLRDWTISRQLWWGHQIPAWYTPDGEVIVARSEEEAREKAGTERIDAGSGRARHLVFLSALAFFNAGLAGRNRRSEDVLSHFSAGYCARHNFSLGLADGDDGHEVHGRTAV